MKISYDYGHMASGADTSANGIVYEYAEIRKYGPVVVNELMRRGHQLINCTAPNGKFTLNESLSYRVDKANKSNSNLHICFHVNAFKTTSSPMGAEIEVASDAGAKYGQSVLNEICKLGFKNRGIKRPPLYVTGHTNAVAILIEPFFVDSKADVALYNCNTLGAAIAKGIINIIGGNKSTPVVVKATSPTIAKAIVQPNRTIELIQQFLNSLGLLDASGHKLATDGVSGDKTRFVLNLLSKKL